MKCLHIVGGRDHGKTTLVVALVEEFTRRGYRLGTVKHTCHEHELDTPGKDSHRHRVAGGSPAAILGPSLLAVYCPSPPGEEAYRLLAPLYRGCDLVLVEGGVDGSGPKIEVWRREKGTAPLAGSRHDILALVSDDPIAIPVPVWPRCDVPALVDRLCRLMKLENPRNTKVPMVAVSQQRTEEV